MTDASRRTGTTQVYTWEPSNRAIAARYGVRPEEVVRFDTNTSPAAPDWIPDVVGGPFEPSLNEYPDSEYEELTEAIAAYVGVSVGEIVVGCGADEILDIVAKAALPAGGTAIVPAPTYGMYGVLTSQRAAQAVVVPRLGAEGGFGLDLDRLIAALPGVNVVWLCDPNNPTGQLEPADAVTAVLEATERSPGPPPIVVVDEAYFEFSGRTVVGLRERWPNLIVVRTVSKAFALPGARVGWAVATRPTIARLETVRPPGSVSTISARLGAAALAHPAWMRGNVARLVAERERFGAGLLAAGWAPYPSVTNFLLARIGDHDAAEAAAERLLHAGLVPRTFGPANPLRGHLRLTVRSAAENDRLLAAVTG
jgi:histidinol-phosphate aminotransferase